VPEIFPDESPYAKWSKSFTGAELSALLRKNAIDIGTVVSVQVTGYSEAGRVMGLKLADKAGKTVTLTGEGQLRLFYSLGSRKYTVQADIPSVSVLGAEGQVVQVSPTGLKVATAGGVVSNLDRTDAYRIQGASSTVSSNASALGFVFVGSGAGHGAGLSQWGAYSMAKNGISYDQILKHYFQGTEILQLGD
jgi:stage II sporulation protein D